MQFLIHKLRPPTGLCVFRWLCVKCTLVCRWYMLTGTCEDSKTGGWRPGGLPVSCSILAPCSLETNSNRPASGSSSAQRLCRCWVSLPKSLYWAISPAPDRSIFTWMYKYHSLFSIPKLPSSVILINYRKK